MRLNLSKEPRSVIRIATLAEPESIAKRMLDHGVGQVSPTISTTQGFVIPRTGTAFG
jgi:hypothetical protein